MVGDRDGVMMPSWVLEGYWGCVETMPWGAICEGTGSWVCVCVGVSAGEGGNSERGVAGNAEASVIAGDTAADEAAGVSTVMKRSDVQSELV